MSTTTPPGWYPDPVAPAVERWWDGTAWSGHTRPADGPPPAAVVVPPKRFGGRPARVAVAVLAVAAVASAAVLLRPGGQTPAAPPPSPGAAAPSVPAPSASGLVAGPSAAPAEGGALLVDQLNGVGLPLPKGWEKAESGIDQTPAMVTAGDHRCPDGTRPCHPGRVLSRTLASAAPTHRAMAEADVAQAAEQLYGEDALGGRPYGGVTGHRVVAARETVVAGRTGYLVRWRVTTGRGPGGHVQSLVFPSPGGAEQPVAVRFAFDAGPDGPPLSVMDEITRGIRPLDGPATGGVGSSLAPGDGGRPGAYRNVRPSPR